MAYSFFEDHEGTIWIGTKGKGLIAARHQHTASLKFQLHHYMVDDKDLYSLSGNEIYSLYEDTNQRLWIATFEGGINYLDLKTAMQFPRFIHVTEPVPSPVMDKVLYGYEPPPAY